jgi:hypothetical protein
LLIRTCVRSARQGTLKAPAGNPQAAAEPEREHTFATEIVALLPIEDGRGPRRRTYVHVGGLAAPIVASRSEEAILADMKNASRSGHRGTQSDDRTGQPMTSARHRRSRLVFGARRD